MAREYTVQGKRIQDRRKELGYSQEEFAEVLQTSQTQVSRWERGDMLPSGKYLDQLAIKLDVDPGYILLQQDQKKRRQQDELSDAEAELLDMIRIGNATRALDIMNTLIKQGKK